MAGNVTLPEGLISRREAAKRLGVHYNTIRGWEQDGTLTARRVMHGRQEEVRFSASQIEELVRRKRAELVESLGAETLEAHVAALEAENRLLREELDEARRERARLLDAVLRRSEVD